jgi:choline dehydrogenase-like flavoprotein
VRLSERRDQFGRAQLQVHWRVGAESRRAQRRLHELIAERVRAQGLGTFESPLLADGDFEAPFTDARHPMGSTRMSRDPRQGVVDRDLRVHALENLHVAGSSVFPTGGCAGPTLTIVALALRLADHLRTAR